MTTTKKLTIAVISLSLALVLVIGGTLAFLVAESNEVTNTFTYGNIQLTLTEENGNNTTGMSFEGVVPGDELEKDPTVNVLANSEDCYVYVLVDNQLDTAAGYNIGADWEKIGESGTMALYRYGDDPVKKSDSDQPLPVFTKLTFADTLDKAGVDALEGKEVVIKAYAHQAKNIESVAVADTAALTWAGVDAVNN